LPITWVDERIAVHGRADEIVEGLTPADGGVTYWWGFDTIKREPCVGKALVMRLSSRVRGRYREAMEVVKRSKSGLVMPWEGIRFPHGMAYLYAPTEAYSRTLAAPGARALKPGPAIELMHSCLLLLSEYEHVSYSGIQTDQQPPIRAMQAFWPGNFLLGGPANSSNCIRLVDFSFGSDTLRVRDQHALEFFPPEAHSLQAAIGPKADIYCIGATLLFSITGVIHTPGQAVYRLPAGFGTRLQSLLAAMLEPSPVLRPTVRQTLSHLEAMI